MYSLKERINEIDDSSRTSGMSGSRGASAASATRGVSGTKQVSNTNDTGTAQEQRGSSILAAKRRRHLHPFLFHMGPVALCLTSVLLIGLLAVLYLSQVGQAVSDNQQIQQAQAQQNALQRQNQDLTNTISNEQSPGYIAQKAKGMGLVPGDPNAVTAIKVKNLKPVPNNNPNIQP
jgi:cell division protein FtsB